MFKRLISVFLQFVIWNDIYSCNWPYAVDFWSYLQFGWGWYVKDLQSGTRRTTLMMVTLTTGGQVVWYTLVSLKKMMVTWHNISNPMLLSWSLWLPLLPSQNFGAIMKQHFEILPFLCRSGTAPNHWSCINTFQQKSGCFNIGTQVSPSWQCLRNMAVLSGLVWCAQYLIPSILWHLLEVLEQKMDKCSEV